MGKIIILLIFLINTLLISQAQYFDNFDRSNTSNIAGQYDWVGITNFPYSGTIGISSNAMSAYNDFGAIGLNKALNGVDSNSVKFVFRQKPTTPGIYASVEFYKTSFNWLTDSVKGLSLFIGKSKTGDTLGFYVLRNGNQYFTSYYYPVRVNIDTVLFYVGNGYAYVRVRRQNENWVTVGGGNTYYSGIPSNHYLWITLESPFIMDDVSLNYGTQSSNIETPVLLSPTNNATGINNPVMLSWSSVSGAQLYRILLTDTIGSVVIYDSTTSTSYNCPTLSPLKKYLWKVGAKVDNIWGNYSSEFNFRMGYWLTNPPSAPTLTSPTNNSQNVELNPTLSWQVNSSDSVTLNIVYVYLNAGQTTLYKQDSTSQNQYQLSNLNEYTSYWWKVRSKNRIGYSNFSSLYKFTTYSSQPPPDTIPPTILFHSCNSVVQNESTMINISASDNYAIKSVVFYKGIGENLEPFDTITYTSNYPTQISVQSKKFAYSDTGTYSYGFVVYDISDNYNADMGNFRVNLAKRAWITAYLPYWELYYGNGNWGRLRADSIKKNWFTHLIMFAVGIDANGNIITNDNHRSDRLRPFNRYLRSKGFDQPILFCIGGAGSSGSLWNSAASPSNRSRFINNILAFMDTLEYDGVDIDIEPLNTSDTANVGQFLRILRDSLNVRKQFANSNRTRLLTAAMLPAWVGIFYAKHENIFDQINIMTYDAAVSLGWGITRTWHSNPLFSPPPPTGTNLYYTSAQSRWLQQRPYSSDVNNGNVNYKKYGLGIDYNGMLYRGGVYTTGIGCYAPKQIWTTAPTYTSDYKFYTMWATYLDTAKESIKFDNESKNPYVSVFINDGNPANETMVSFTDSTTIDWYMKTVSDSGFGGLIIWNIGEGFLSAGYPSPANKYYYSRRTGGLMMDITSEIAEKYFILKDSPPPQPPILASPSNKSTGHIPPITLKWLKKNLATRYELLVTDSSGAIIINTVITDTQYTINTLMPNINYFWKVRVDSNNVWSNYSSEWEFKTGIYLVFTPSPPTLTYPSNNATNIPKNVNLQWSVSSSDSVLMNNIMLSRFSNFSSYLINDSTSSNTYQVLNLQYDTSYYWRVRSRNRLGYGGWSQVYKFTVMSDPSPPNTPTLISPTNNSTGVLLSSRLRWSRVSNANNYRLIVVKNLVPTDTAINVITADTSYPITSLNYNTTYRWVVMAGNANGWSAPTAAWIFTTQNMLTSVPFPPTIVNPSNNSTNNPILITFTWTVNASDSVIENHIQIANDSLYNDLKFDDTYTGNQANYGIFKYNTTYYWRVRSRNRLGYGGWSIAKFTIMPYPFPPDSTTLLYPPNGSTNILLSSKFVWRKVDYATKYRLVAFKTNQQTDTLINNSNITDTSYTMMSLPFNQSISWRVFAGNTNGWSSPTSIYTFTTIDTVSSVPQKPTLLIPQNFSRYIDIENTEFIWSVQPYDSVIMNHIQLSDDQYFSNIIINDSTQSNTYISQITLIENTAYFWRVRSRNRFGYSNWSNTFSFITMWEGEGTGIDVGIAWWKLNDETGKPIGKLKTSPTPYIFMRDTALPIPPVGYTAIGAKGYKDATGIYYPFRADEAIIADSVRVSYLADSVKNIIFGTTMLNSNGDSVRVYLENISNYSVIATWEDVGFLGSLGIRNKSPSGFTVFSSADEIASKKVNYIITIRR